MSRTAVQASEFGQLRSSAPVIDRFTLVPLLACFYATVAAPVFYFATAPEAHTLQAIMETRWEHRIFWPAMTAISLILVAQNFVRLTTLRWPLHIIALALCLAFAGASVLWALYPQTSFMRFAQQAMVLTSVVVPAMLAARTVDLMRGVFLCFAIGAILNVFFVLNNPADLVNAYNGYPGYFMGKNYLGEFAAATLFLALHEVLRSGTRRLLGIVFAVVAAVLLFVANSKTAMGLAIVVPALAGLMLIVRRLTGISPAVFLLCVPVCYLIVSSISGISMNHISYLLYGDSTFTGRTLIWDFANYEIGRRPLFGWGYQSFWLVGPDSPSIVEAPGWIKGMPNSHNGYVDIMVELGYIGLTLVLGFVVATFHASGRVAERDAARGWLLLSLALFVTMYNFLESLWMRGFEFLWVLFVIVAAEAARCTAFPSTSRGVDGRHRNRPTPTSY